MRRLLVSAALLTACFLPKAASADTLTTFTLNGTFQNGGTLQGTFLIDTTLGQVVTTNLILNADGINVNAVIPPRGQGPDLGFFQVDFGSFSSYPQSNLNVLLPTPSLLGYAGGPICSTHLLCGPGFPSDLSTSPVSGNVFDPFVTGSLVPVPEPESAFLVALGLLAAAGKIRQRLHRQHGI